VYYLPKPYVLDPTPWTLRPECLDTEIYIDAFSAYLHLTVIPIALSQRTLNVANTVPKNGRLARAAGGNDPVVTSARVMSSYRFSTIMQQSKVESADLSFARDPRAMPPPSPSAVLELILRECVSAMRPSALGPTPKSPPPTWWLASQKVKSVGTEILAEAPDLRCRVCVNLSDGPRNQMPFRQIANATCEAQNVKKLVRAV